MNLSKRTTFVILPVILICYALAAVLFFQNQCEALRQHEQNQLDYKVGQLQAHFSSYSSFAKAYQTTLLESNALANFLREPESIYRGRILYANLENAVAQFFHNKYEFAAISIFNRQNQLSFYIENSTDPFSSASPEQFKLSQKIIADESLNTWEHVKQGKGSIVQHGFVLDSRTFNPPTLNDLSHAIQVIISVRPSKFDALLQTIQKDYTANISITESLTPSNDSTALITSSVELREGYYLNVTPADSYIKSKLLVVLSNLTIIVTLSSLATFLLLHFLIRYFITSPISQLDKQITAIMTQEQTSLMYPENRGEISDLGQKFAKLYQQLQKSLNRTHEQSRTDALTQLPNRSAFYENADALLAKAQEDNRFITIIYLDLDNFKFVNDKFGHIVGDRLLKTVSEQLKNTIARYIDVKCNTPNVYRLSGDEFLILLPTYTDALAETIAQDILDLFSHGHRSELGYFPVTSSMGIVHFPEDGQTLSKLISNADLAMYQAKKSGKNTYAFYSQELAKSDRYIKDIESRLKDINFDQEFSLHFMPIVDPDYQVTGCEALLRWHSPELGSISPAIFIPIAEQIGLFEKIDLWVVEAVFQQLPTLKKQLGDDIYVSLNISSAELTSERFIKILNSLEEHYKVNTQDIVIEITETFESNTDAKALVWLEHLRKRGYRIAIDDFGTGSTSFMQMMEYPVDMIKFDRKLVDRITEPQKQELSKSLIDLCHLQNIKVVAEGIETSTQFKIMDEAECDFLQGYLIAQPMPIESLRNWKDECQPEPAPEI